MSTYLVNEVYPCLQGEGANVGLPSVLVRFQICNLRCTWCDTPYTHTRASDPVDAADLTKGQKFRRMDVAQLASEIRSHLPLKHLILSGGEPTLHNLVPIMDALKEYTAEIETNGTRVPHKEHAGFDSADYVRFQWNVSPKGANAGESWNRESLSFWGELSRSHSAVFFKFVVRQANAEEDLGEAESCVASFGVPRDRVMLMAEGTNVDSQVGQTWLHDLCLARGFRYTPRLHVLLFGPRRGV